MAVTHTASANIKKKVEKKERNGGITGPPMRRGWIGQLSSGERSTTGGQVVQETKKKTAGVFPLLLLSAL
ncbi:unnamed protein product [Caenorhabditis auriculariae]|uniref:Uncharacterized protein n=1 Tax=Caenorhabditis auriculariae TaxID=2777116 RepID=A0A8S1H3N7_9PELO|nr:unnamed protein product [Caenorhabditis auriculariae]